MRTLAVHFDRTKVFLWLPRRVSGIWMWLGWGASFNYVNSKAAD
jgi:hypothetical protein